MYNKTAGNALSKPEGFDRWEFGDYGGHFFLVVQSIMEDSV